MFDWLIKIGFIIFYFIPLTVGVVAGFFADIGVEPTRNVQGVEKEGWWPDEGLF